MPEERDYSRPGRSTGPRTLEGKAKASQNSTKHGCCSNKLILPGEKQEEYDELLLGWMDAYEPTTAEAVYLVQEACTAQWFLIRNRGRYNEAEQRVCGEQPDALDWTEEQHRLIERFRRYMTQAERQFNRAFSMLEQLRKNRFRESMTRARLQERAQELELKRASQAEKPAAVSGGGLAKREGVRAPAGRLFQPQNEAARQTVRHGQALWLGAG